MTLRLTERFDSAQGAAPGASPCRHTKIGMRSPSGILALEIRTSCSEPPAVSLAQASDTDITLSFNPFTPFEHRTETRIGRVKRIEFNTPDRLIAVWLVTALDARLNLEQDADTGALHLWIGG